MHTILYVDRGACPDWCCARFTVHLVNGSTPLGPPVELKRENERLRAEVAELKMQIKTAQQA